MIRVSMSIDNNKRFSGVFLNKRCQISHSKTGIYQYSAVFTGNKIHVIISVVAYLPDVIGNLFNL